MCRGLIVAAALLALTACQGQQPPPPDGERQAEGVFGTAEGSPTAGATPTTSPTAGAGATPVPQSTVVRADGFLRSEDMGIGSVEILPSSRVSEARINPCGDTSLPSDAARVARAAAFIMFQFGEPEGSTPDGTGYEVLARYRAGGASAYLADVRDAVGRCPTDVEGSSTLEREIVDEGFAGDESVLVTHSHTYEFEGVPSTAVGMTAALRVGELVIIVDVDGWEGTDVSRSDLDRLITAAILRAADA
jgi:hypothetical protein